MVTRMFKDKIGSMIKVYIDYMMVKSKRDERHVMDLNETFEIQRRHKLRLNANKCAFGIGARKCLGYMITNRGIEVNPNQMRATQQLSLPSNPKDVQKLTRMIVTPNNFVSKLADRCKPFFQLLRKWRGF